MSTIAKNKSKKRSKKDLVDETDNQDENSLKSQSSISENSSSSSKKSSPSSKSKQKQEKKSKPTKLSPPIENGEGELSPPSKRSRQPERSSDVQSSTTTQSAKTPDKNKSKSTIKTTLETNSPAKSSSSKPLKVMKSPDKLNGTSTLPRKYSDLEEEFAALETILWLKRTRGSICTPVDQVLQSIQENTKRSFSIDRIRMILTVSPDFFKLSYIMNPDTFQSSIQVAKSEAFLLSIEQCFKHEQSIAELQQRRIEFHSKLYSIASSHLKKTLSSPIGGSSSNLLEESFPEIEKASLPQPPIAISKPKSISELVEAKTSTKNSILAQAVKSATFDPSIVKLNQGQVQSLLESKPVPKELSALKTETIVKGRLMDSQKEQDKRDDLQGRMDKLRIYSKLPLLFDIIVLLFAQDKNRKSIYLSELVSRIHDQHREQPPVDEIKKQISTLLEVVPEWCSLLKLSKDSCFRIDLNVDFSQIREKLTSLQSEI